MSELARENFIASKLAPTKKPQLIPAAFLLPQQKKLVIPAQAGIQIKSKSTPALRETRPNSLLNIIAGFPSARDNQRLVRLRA